MCPMILRLYEQRERERSFDVGELKEKKAKAGSRRQLNWSPVEEEGWNARWGLGCALVGLQRCSSLWELVEDSRTSTGRNEPPVVLGEGESYDASFQGSSRMGQLLFLRKEQKKDTSFGNKLILQRITLILCSKRHKPSDKLTIKSGGHRRHKANHLSRTSLAPKTCCE